MSTQFISPYQAAKILATKNNILIICHRRPDGDTIGSASALAHTLKNMGKRVHIFKNQDITEKLRPFADSFAPPEDFEPAFYVSVDIASADLFPENGEHLAGRVDLAIDHHPSSSFFSPEVCNYPEHAACGEIIYKIILALSCNIPQEVALPLYLAISTDTGCFRYSNTSPNTHRVAADLMDTGIDYAALNRTFFTEKSKARMLLESAFLSTMTLHKNDSIAVAYLTPEMVRQCGANSDDEEDIVGVIRAVEGVLAAVMIRELPSGKCKISLRTNQWLSANKVCSRFGGGGHAAAAGCTIDADVETAKRLMLEAIESETNG